MKVNNRNTRTRCEICSKLTIKIPERHHWCRSGIFIVHFEHISHLVSNVNFEHEIVLWISVLSSTKKCLEHILEWWGSQKFINVFLPFSAIIDNFLCPRCIAWSGNLKNITPVCVIYCAAIFLHFCHAKVFAYFMLCQPSFSLRKKSSYSELFWSAFFPHFAAFGLNTEGYFASLRIQSECEKIREKFGSE